MELEMLFGFELDALEAETNGAVLTEEETGEELTFFDEEYFSWEMHDFFQLDFRSDYLYPFQKGYSAEVHPHNYSIEQAKGKIEREAHASRDYCPLGATNEELSVIMWGSK